MPFVFGNTKYKTKTMQKKISEHGPKTVCGARRQLSKNSRESHLTLCHTGAGRCVMLTSTKPGMDGSQWNIVPRSTRAMKIFAKGRQEQCNVTPTLADNTPLTTNTNASRSSATTITTLSSTSPKKAAQLKPTKVLKCAPTKADAGQPTQALKKKKEVLKKAAARQPKKVLKKKKKVVKMVLKKRKKVVKCVAPTRRFARSTAIEPCFTGDVKQFIQDLWVAKKGEVCLGPVIRMMRASGHVVSEGLKRRVKEEIEEMGNNEDNHYDSEEERQQEETRRRRERVVSDTEEEECYTEEECEEEEDSEEEEEDEEEEVDEEEETSEHEDTAEEDAAEEEDDTAEEDAAEEKDDTDSPTTPKPKPATLRVLKTDTTSASKTSWVHEFLKQQGCVMLTETQRDPAWFLFRLFVITSTSAFSILKRLDPTKLTLEQQHLIEQDLGVRLKQPEDEEERKQQEDDFLQCQEIPEDELNSRKCTIQVLKKVLKFHGRKTTGNSLQWCRK